MWTSGLLTVDLERAHLKVTGDQLHVWLDGVDVTRRCFRADDVNGYVMIYCEDPVHHEVMVTGGARHLSPHCNARDEPFVCQHTLQGKVVIAPGAHFPGKG